MRARVQEEKQLSRAERSDNEHVHEALAKESEMVASQVRACTIRTCDIKTAHAFRMSTYVDA
jgi:hypothetical protein